MSKKNFSFTAVTIFLILLWTPLLLFPFNCPDGHCSLAPNSSWSSVSSAPSDSSGKQTSAALFHAEYASPHPAVARICVENAQTRNYGTGTWIRISKDQCAILTCAHLFETNSPERIAVSFPNHFSFNARIQAINRDWDVALLQSAVGTDSSFSNSFPTPIILTLKPPKPEEYVRVCGYGSDGRSLWILGVVRGYCRLSTVSGAHTLVVSGTARQGDSGAPILTLDGNLAGVLWGTDGQSLYGTWSGQIMKILAIDFSVPFISGEYFVQDKEKVLGDGIVFSEEEFGSVSVDSSESVEFQNLPKSDRLDEGKTPHSFNCKTFLNPEDKQSDSNEYSKELLVEDTSVSESFWGESENPDADNSNVNGRGKSEENDSVSSFPSSFSFKNHEKGEAVSRRRIFGELFQDTECSEKNDDSGSSSVKNEQFEIDRRISEKEPNASKRKEGISLNETKSFSWLLMGLYLLAWSMPVTAFVFLLRKQMNFQREKRCSWNSYRE